MKSGGRSPRLIWCNSIACSRTRPAISEGTGIDAKKKKCNCFSLRRFGGGGKQMSTRLGLDIGTNSIGWCLYDGDSIRDIGVRIFSDGREPPKAGTEGRPLAEKRRLARSMRRRRDRYLGRRSALVELLVNRGLLPADNRQAKELHSDDPYGLRNRALSEKLAPHQIGRALFHLNQRRGFKSNRKADRVARENEDGKIASGTKALDQAMAEAGARTLGQFLNMRNPDQGETRRVQIRPDTDSYDFYPDRRHYEDEFDQDLGRAGGASSRHPDR